jgi:hypothetical protein
MQAAAVSCVSRMRLASSVVALPVFNKALRRILEYNRAKVTERRRKLNNVYYICYRSALY